MGVPRVTDMSCNFVTNESRVVDFNLSFNNRIDEKAQETDVTVVEDRDGQTIMHISLKVLPFM